MGNKFVCHMCLVLFIVAFDVVEKCTVTAVVV